MRTIAEDVVAVVVAAEVDAAAVEDEAKGEEVDEMEEVVQVDEMVDAGVDAEVVAVKLEAVEEAEEEAVVVSTQWMNRYVHKNKAHCLLLLCCHLQIFLCCSQFRLFQVCRRICGRGMHLSFV